MGKTYTSTIQLKSRKEHTCAGCGAVYSYVLQRKVVGSSRSAEKASEIAKKKAAKTRATAVDFHPCPTCGLYQLDMVGQRKAKRFVPILALSFVFFPVFLIARGAHGFQSELSTWIITGLCVAALVFYGLIDLKNMNGNPDGNRQLAADQIAKSDMFVTTTGRAGTPAESLVSPPQTIFHRLALPLLLGAVVLAAAPEIERRVHHWPLNEACYPPVVGPGDTTRIYMTQSIETVKGYWHGIPQVILDQGGLLNISMLDCKTNESNWGSSISAKSSEKYSKVHPWIEFGLPQDQALANKSVEADLHLSITYPKMSGSSNFRVTHTTMDQKNTIQLATARAGHEYNSTWWIGSGVASALVIIAGLILLSSAKQYDSLAPPTRVTDV